MRLENNSYGVQNRNSPSKEHIIVSRHGEMLTPEYIFIHVAELERKYAKL